MVRQKTGGRQKGTPNKITLEIRTELQKFVKDNLSCFYADIGIMQPKERLAILIQMLPYVVPKMAVLDEDEENEVAALPCKIEIIYPQN